MKQKIDIRKFIIRAGIILAVVFCCSILALHIWIGQSVKQNIEIAKQQYPGKAEDALIAFLLDDNNTFHDRTHIAVWTLGQIKSEKALDILNPLYTGDAKGKTCYGKHGSMLCQYEIHKAIVQIKSKWTLSHARLNI